MECYVSRLGNIVYSTTIESTREQWEICDKAVAIWIYIYMFYLIKMCTINVSTT